MAVIGACFSVCAHPMSLEQGDRGWCVPNGETACGYASASSKELLSVLYTSATLREPIQQLLDRTLGVEAGG